MEYSILSFGTMWNAAAIGNASDKGIKMDQKCKHNRTINFLWEVPTIEEDVLLNRSQNLVVGGQPE
jgi:hypothetical protein